MVTKKRSFFLIFCFTTSVRGSFPAATAEQQPLIDFVALILTAGSVLGNEEKTPHECRHQVLVTLQILRRHLNFEADGSEVMSALPHLELLFSSPGEIDPLTRLMQQTHHTLLEEQAALHNNTHHLVGGIQPKNRTHANNVPVHQ